MRGIVVVMSPILSVGQCAASARALDAAARRVLGGPPRVHPAAYSANVNGSALRRTSIP